MLGAVAGLADEAERVAAGFAPALAAATQAAWRELAARGRLHADAAPPDGELPWAFREMLASAIAVEEREGSERAALLRRHYLELMPRQRVEQMATTAEPNATLFHTRLDAARLPRLRAALDRLYALVEGAGVDPARALPAATPEALLVNFPTVARLYAVTHYGGFMPLLYGTPADLARAAVDLTDVQSDAQTAIDRHLTAPIVHELAHFGRRRRGLLPLYLDECVAGHVGVLAHPAFAYPTEADVDALYASPWFAQVGQALARVVGTPALVRAHAGAADWRDVLPDGFLDEALAAGWNEYVERRGPHFLSDSFRPDPWLARILAHEAPPDDEADEAILADALRAMCLENRVEAGAYVVSTRPPPGPIVVDVAARRVTTPLRAGTADTVPPAYFVPPAVARRLEALGIKALSVEIDDPGKILALAAVLRRAVLHELGPWRASFS